MAKVRRSLSAALNVSPEALAFIEGAKTVPDSVKPPPTMVRKQVGVSDIEEGEGILEEPPELSPAAKQQESRTRSRQRRNQAQEVTIPLGMAGLLVPLTTRVSPRIATALKRAGLEQKLRGSNPRTVQEIVDEAIESWLQKYGFLT